VVIAEVVARFLHDGTTMDDPVNFLSIGTGLLGGLAMFLYGMHTMSEGLKLAAGDGMKKLLRRLTTNRFTAALTGAFVTAVIQSSSVTTILVVGFVSAGLMSLSQSIGIIMGANIGTTITAQVVAFKVTAFAWVLVAAGFAVWAFPRRQVVKEYGTMILGLGLLFIGMEQMSEATGPLRTYGPFVDLMARMDNPAFGILLGAAFTALVQSSSATTGIVIMLASQGFLSLEAGIALALGANIGTCVTAILSAIGKPAAAVRSAVVHVMINVIGALIWVGLISQLADVARELSPARTDLDGLERLAAETPRQVANANTLFNVANTLILIWFVHPIGRLAVKLVPERKSLPPARVDAKYLDKVYLDTPSLALDRLRLELVHMGRHVVGMIGAARDAYRARNRGQLEKVAGMDADIDRLHAAILAYAAALGREDLSDSEAREVEKVFLIVNHLESMGDLIGKDVVAQGKHALSLSDEGREVDELLDPLWELALSTTSGCLNSLESGEPGEAEEVNERKAEIHASFDRAMGSLGALLKAEKVDLGQFRIGADLMGQIKRLYYNARKIAQVVIRSGGEAG
jgi:phosphate:Na+ symporter